MGLVMDLYLVCNGCLRLCLFGYLLHMNSLGPGRWLELYDCLNVPDISIGSSILLDECPEDPPSIQI